MSKNKITAVLGPTNTGKTYLAIETMLSFDSGMIGFPLRFGHVLVYFCSLSVTTYSGIKIKGTINRNV